MNGVFSDMEEKELKDTTENTGKPGKKVKWFIPIAVVCVLIAGAYVGIAMYYRSHFLPNSSVNGIESRNMDAQSVARQIAAQISRYSLEVTGRDYNTGKSGAVLGTIRPEEIGLSYVDCLEAVQELLQAQNEWLWPAAYAGEQKSYSLEQGVEFDEELLRTVVTGWDACRKGNMTAPTDAYISEYNDEKKGYEIIPETQGNELDIDRVIECIESEIYAQNTTVDLEQMECYKEAKIKQTDKNLTDAVDTVNTWLGTVITYDWNDNEVVLDVETLKDWITMEQGKPVLDEEAVEAFVKQQARQYDTYGKKKNFVTVHGVEMTLGSPNYGWKTDTETEAAELMELIYQGSQAEKEPAYSIRAKRKGSNDIGDSYIEADLTHQHVYVHKDGEIVFETDCVSGRMNSTPGCVTPPGIFGLTYKTTNAVLRGADYETPVTYWMPFYGNYGMHDATWRSHFGGTIYQEHGSHGCINLPLASAATIYEYVSTGFPVICYYYEKDPLETAPAEGQTLTEEELLQEHEPTIDQNQENAETAGQEGQ